MQKLHGKDMIETIEAKISSTLYFSGRTTIFFGCSASQLREQQLLFIDVESLPNSGNVNSRGKRGNTVFDIYEHQLRSL